jgi:CheY-like chemotaxis protein
VRSVRVLVAEDNEDHLFLTTIALQSTPGADVEVIGCRDGVEAMDRLSAARGPADHPDLVLLDLSMPRRNGIQVLADIKGDDALSTIPVVVLTSSDQPDDIRACYELGANSYVTKGGDLSDVVSYWLRTASLPPR